MSSQAIKVAKQNHKQALKNKANYISNRDKLVKQMLKAQTPNWGSVKIILINW